MLTTCSLVYGLCKCGGGGSSQWQGFDNIWYRVPFLYNGQHLCLPTAIAKQSGKQSYGSSQAHLCTSALWSGVKHKGLMFVWSHRGQFPCNQMDTIQYKGARSLRRHPRLWECLLFTSCLVCQIIWRSSFIGVVRIFCEKVKWARNHQKINQHIDVVPARLDFIVQSFILQCLTWIHLYKHYVRKNAGILLNTGWVMTVAASSVTDSNEM